MSNITGTGGGFDLSTHLSTALQALGEVWMPFKKNKFGLKYPFGGSRAQHPGMLERREEEQNEARRELYNFDSGGFIKIFFNYKLWHTQIGYLENLRTDLESISPESAKRLRCENVVKFEFH